MKKYTEIEKANFINLNLKRYIKSTFQIEDDDFRNQFTKQIDDVSLMKGPYISLLTPFETGNTINELITEGILSSEFIKFAALDVNRPLYLHQEKSIRASARGENLVISTGTGSGKTEGFLIPILNEIISDIKNGLKDRGVQAMLLYPMNALANDQRSRLREIVEDYPEISFGFYTGETVEDQKTALNNYRAENNREPLSNEYISREKIRMTPPNILFTNYSMLEYILLRPNDSTIFTPEKTANWKYIVLDEAHTYRGALGIEISLLIKRLLGNISSKPKFILTSATLANEKKDFPAVVAFANRLTSKKFELSGVILGKRKRIKNTQEFHQINVNDYKRLLTTDDYVISKYNEHFPNNPNLKIEQRLHALLINDSNFNSFVQVLNHPLDIKKLISLLGSQWNNDSITSLINLINKVNTESTCYLVDIRYHSFYKTLDGAYISLRPEKKLTLRKTNNHIIRDGDGNEKDKLKAFELALCKYCKCSYILGRIKDEFFYQVDDEELYEQYSEEYNKNTNILLIKELVDNIDEIESKRQLIDVKQNRPLRCSISTDGFVLCIEFFGK